MSQDLDLRTMLEKLMQTQKTLSDSVADAFKNINARLDKLENQDANRNNKDEVKEKDEEINNKEESHPTNEDDIDEDNEEEEEEEEEDQPLPPILPKDLNIVGNKHKSKRTKDKAKKEDEATRRSSILTYDKDNATKGYSSTPRLDRMVVASAEPFSQPLRTLYINQIVKFKRALYEYQRDTGVAQPAATAIIDSLKLRLINENLPHLTVVGWDCLSDAEVFQCIVKSALPTNPQEWISYMKRSVKFPILKDYYASLVNFDIAYGAIIQYSRDFLEVYEYLTHTLLPPEYVPSVYSSVKVPNTKHKFESLTELYLGGMPHELGGELHVLLVNKRRPKSIEAYIELYLARLKEYNSACITLRSLATILGKYNKQAAVPTTPKILNALKGTSDYFTDGYNEDNTALVEEETHEYSDSGGHDYYTGYNNDNAADDTLYHIDTDDPGPDTQQVATTANGSLNNVNGYPASDARKLPCFQLVNGQECKRGNACSYSHSPADIHRGRQDLIKRLQSIPDKSQPYGILKRPTRDPPTAPAAGNPRGPPSSLKPFSTSTPAHSSSTSAPHGAKRFGNLSNAVASDDDIYSQFYSTFQAPNSFLGALSSLRHGERSLVEVDAILTGNVKCIALCDSGAVSDNYMSMQFYQEHKELLTHKIDFATSSVTLGDTSTTKKIYGIVTCGITLPDGSTATISFSLFDTNHEVVIGLPTLLNQLFDFYINLLHKARSSVLGRSPAKWLSMLVPALGPAIQAPEEDAEPSLSAFNIPTEFLSYLDTSHETAIKKYLDMFDTHVSPEFATQTPIIEYLKSRAIQSFVPTEWTGISDLVISIPFKELPQRKKPHARPIPHRFISNAEPEFRRMCTYFYVPSTSDIACCLHVASKATEPFCRLVGDYTPINHLMEIGHEPIPAAFSELQKIAKFKYFADIDLANAFHQFKLDDATSDLLSLVTPWGQFRPVFMPEGIGPATGILQRTMRNIFRDFREWSIVLFDNILLLGNDLPDLYTKVVTFVERCIERHIILKFAKSWLGVTRVKFFGYICEHNKFSLDTDRVEAVRNIPFPTNGKQMSRFLGTANFFSPFTPNYSIIVAPLFGMTSKSFNWDSSTWTVDYPAVFEQAKLAIADASTLYYPDFNLDFVLRTDASDTGTGAVLYQVSTDGVLQPLKCVGTKFSAVALNWPTIEKELYAVVHACLQLQEYIRGKRVILQVDHRNLLWLQKSIVPKIVRWRMLLQSFDLVLQHIPGVENVVADAISRAHHSPVTATLSLLSAAVSDTERIDPLVSIPTSTTMSDTARTLYDSCTTKVDLIQKIHGGRNGHHGIKRTWHILNEHFPGHNISVKEVTDYINECPICQKQRLLHRPSLPDQVHTLHVPRYRSCIGIDTLEIGEDTLGNRYLQVIVNFYSKYVYFHATPAKGARPAAVAVFKYICAYGLLEEIRTDPGSEFTAESFELLCTWLGLRHTLTMVHRPQADGVEGTNKQILRHIRALVADERIKDKWSSDEVLPIVQLLVNESPSSETGIIPIHATFGDYISVIHSLQERGSTVDLQRTYAAELQQNFKILYDISTQYQQDVKDKRTTTDISPVNLNRYHAGDFVFYIRAVRNHKLDTLAKGPYQVLRHIDGKVECRDLVYGTIKYFAPTDVNIFIGDKAAATAMALLDNDQYVVTRILGHKGSPAHRSDMFFLVEYQDGDVLWMQYSQDIATTSQFATYCNSRGGLPVLLYSVQQLSLLRKQHSQQPLTVQEHEICYVDVSVFGYAWFLSKKLPNCDTRAYVCECRYGKRKNNKQVYVHFSVFTRTKLLFDSWSIYLWCRTTVKDLDIVVTEQLVTQYGLNL